MKLKKISISLAILAVIIACIVFFVLKNKPKTEYSTVKIARGDILQTVSETGAVKSANEIDLNFLNSGRIAKINVKIGDKAVFGQVLAELDCADILKRKDEAQANLNLANASHAKLLAGISKEEINVARASSEQAKKAYEAAEKSLQKTQKSVDESIKQAKKILSDLESSNPQDITTSEQAVLGAEISLDNTRAVYQRLIDNSRDNAIITVEEKLTIANNALDIINKTVKDDTLKNKLSIKNVAYIDSIDRTYAEALILLVNAKASLSSAKSGASSAYVLKMISDAQIVLDKIYLSLQYTYTALENTVVTASLSQSSLDAFKSGISAQQTLISAGIASVQALKQNLDKAVLDFNTNIASAENVLDQARTTHESALRSARNGLSSAEVEGEKQINSAQAQIDAAFEAWQVAQSRYNQTIAPAGQQDIRVSEAKISQAQAALDTLSGNIDNCYIKAPLGGTITKVNFQAGEQPSGKPCISMLGENNFEIEALISEADIAKINIGDFAGITLDAFGEEADFQGSVDFIEPAETVIQDVIYYKVRVAFGKLNSGNGEAGAMNGLKSGMTANVVITTEKKENVLIIPSRAIIDKNGDGKFARILANGIIEERAVALGLRGDGGMTELLSGAKEGENVVTYVSEK